MTSVFEKSSSSSPADTLLIYCAGWGTTAEAVAHLTRPDEWDYLALSDYTTLSVAQLPMELSLTSYKTIHLVAWSMGVWAAEELARQLPLLTTKARCVAVNGTPYPMHDHFGIPTAIFRGTLEGLDDANRERFNRRMCGGKKLLAVYNAFAARSTESLRAELLAVYRSLPGRVVHAPRLRWHHAFVSEKDLVVPPQNQQSYWRKCAVHICLLPGAGHYAFMNYTQWQELL